MFRAKAGAGVTRFEAKYFPLDRAPRLRSYRVPPDAGLTLTPMVSP